MGAAGSTEERLIGTRLVHPYLHESQAEMVVRWIKKKKVDTNDLL